MKRALLAALILGLFGSTARAQVTCVGSACGGSGGSGSGDLLSTNNLSDVASASTSLSNLGGQPLNATLTSISSVTFAADKCLYFTAATTVAAFNCTSFGRSIVNAADAAALRTLAALGTMATQAASSVSITGGTITGITDLVVADGGTGVSSLTAYAPIFGGTTSTGAVQSGTVGTSGQCLTSNGAGALPTFQACSGGGSTVTLGGATSGFASPTIIASVSNLLAAYTLSGTGTVLPTTVSPSFTTPALGTPSAAVLTNATGTAAGLTSGNVTTNANLTGTVTSVGNATAITDGSVANADLANMATATVKCRTTAGTGVPEDCTAAQATAIMNVMVAGGVKGLVPATVAGDATKFLRGDATFQTIPGGGDALTSNPLSQFAATTSAQLATVMSDETGTNKLVYSDSPTLVTPALGTPASGVATNLTGLPLTTGVTGTLPVANGGTGITSFGTGIATWLGTPSSANLIAALTDETGTGAAVFATSPTLVTPILGTPTSGTLTNATGLPVSTGISGLGTGVATFLATPSSANLATAVTDETGSGAAVFATSPTLVTPLLGTPTSGVMTNVTGTATGLTSGITNALKSATTTVDVSAATAPTSGQVLTATAGTTATWQTPGAGGITCADTGVVFADGANTPACDAGMTYNKTTDALTLAGSAIAPVFKSAVGANVAVQATAPTATTGASQAGKTADLTASAAIASTDTAGAAAGGAVTITSGAAARNTSGNAAGGAINLVTGAGIGTGVAGQVIVPAGTSAFPSLSNSQNTGTGIWWRSGSAINVSVNSTAYFGFTNVGSGEFVVNSGAQIGFVSSNVTAANMDTGFARVSAGVMRATNASTEIRALIGGGAAVASATALPVPTGRVFHVTGTTVVTSITSTNFGNGAVITLIFDGILTMTDGNNLVLAGNFVTTADDTLTLVYDGTNWYEIARSVN